VKSEPDTDGKAEASPLREPRGKRFVTLQDLIFKLSEYWSAQGCLIQQPLDLEVGAGTMSPETFLRVLGPTHWNVAYVQPSRRPADGRYGENPNRLYKHHQLQVILKPAPDEVQHLYLQSLEACGIALEAHDVRFEEDNWESPTLGAWGIGWQVLFDGLEITQFTYFQQAGGQELSPISAELTYGLERLAMVLQKVDNVFDLEWAPGVSYREVRLRDEIEQSKYSFGEVGMPKEEFAAFHRDLFERHFEFANRLIDGGLVLPAFEHCLKCSHLFNVLDASGGVGVTERTAYILRVRQLAIAIAKGYTERPTPVLANA
jgi:glycyl-tRNA synthetase alpha chain